MIFSAMLLMTCLVSQATQLTVNITGFEERTGEARLAVFGPGDSFPMEIDEALYKGVMTVDADTLVFTIDSLAPGTYAITPTMTGTWTESWTCTGTVLPARRWGYPTMPPASPAPRVSTTRPSCLVMNPGSGYLLR